MLTITWANIVYNQKLQLIKTSSMAICCSSELCAIV